MGIRPPGVKDTWEDCDVLTQAKIVAFYQTHTHDEWKARSVLAGAPQ